MLPNPLETVNLVTFISGILNGNLNLLCSVILYLSDSFTGVLVSVFGIPLGDRF